MRHNTLCARCPLALLLSLTCATPRLSAEVFTVQFLSNLIPAGDRVTVNAASLAPGGVQIVGSRNFHNGTFDNTPIVFPTASSNMQVLPNPPSDSGRGAATSAANIPGFGALQAGVYDRLSGSTLSSRAAIWNGPSTPGFDLHTATSTLGNDSAVFGLSAAPSGTKPWARRTLHMLRCGLCGTLQSSQYIRLHDSSTMSSSFASGAYTFNGVARQVGWSLGTAPGSVFRARVWSSSSTGVLNLTPSSHFQARIRGGNGDGPTEILYGETQVTALSEPVPAIWDGLGGSYRILDTTATHPWGSVFYANQSEAVGRLDDTRAHAALWHLTDNSVIDLHSWLPSSYQANGVSRAIFADGFGNYYGWARATNSGPDIPVIWTVVPEPSSMILAGSALLGVLRIRKRHAAVLDNNWSGTSTSISRYIDEDLTVAVLCNNESADADSVGLKIASLYRGEKKAETKPAEASK